MSTAVWDGVEYDTDPIVNSDSLAPLVSWVVGSAAVRASQSQRLDQGLSGYIVVETPEPTHPTSSFSKSEILAQKKLWDALAELFLTNPTFSGVDESLVRFWRSGRNDTYASTVRCLLEMAGEPSLRHIDSAEELIDWETAFAVKPRSIGTITVRLRYKGKGKPLPFDDDV